MGENGGMAMKKIKCGVCGKRFVLDKEQRYTAVSAGLSRLTEPNTYYDAFDCPQCGCQIIVGVREKTSIETGKENEDNRHTET